jgi:nitroreductase
MMSFADLARRRYSVRAYRSDPVAPDLLADVLETTRVAPTAANRQPVRLVVVHTAGREKELRRIYDRDWFATAPIVVCACGVPAEGYVRGDGRSYLDVDVAIVMDHLTLAAADAGLGTCWVAAFDEAAARDVLGLPAGIEPVVFTPLGYPADTPGPKQRRPLEDLVRYEHW